VTKTAGHSNQVGGLYVFRILEVLLERPSRLIKVGIRELPKSHHPARLSGDIGNVYAGTLVKPQTVLIGGRGREAAWLRERTELTKSAAVPPRIHILQEVGRAVGSDPDLTPKSLVSSGPEIPSVSTAAFQGTQLRSAVVIGVDPILCGLGRAGLLRNLES